MNYSDKTFSDKTILFRTVCGKQFGTGHLKRCITLATALHSRGLRTLIFVNDEPLSRQIVESFEHVHFLTENAVFPQTSELSFEDISLFIIDLPRFKAGKGNIDAAEVIKTATSLDESGVPVVSLGHVNHLSISLRAVIDLYPGKTIHAANYINGPEYVILKPEFKHAQPRVSKGEGVLITLGGSDPFNITDSAIQAFIQSGLKDPITIVLGAGYSEDKLRQIEALLEGRSNQFRVLKSVSNMNELIVNSRWGIVGFGTTAFEFMSQGVPCMAFSHYKWQEPSAVVFDEIQCCNYVGCAEDGLNLDALSQAIAAFGQDQARLDEIAATSQKVVDGKGAERISKILENFAMQKDNTSLDTLFILAHPGDEVFGCGGTILKKIEEGQKVGVVFLGEGISSRFEEHVNRKSTNDMGKVLKSSVQEVMDKIGVKIWYNYQFTDNRFDAHELLDIIKLVEKLIERHEPAEVYTHMPSDLNIDHKITFEAVQTACRPSANLPVRSLYGIEVPSSTDWNLGTTMPSPNWFNDITHQLDKKIELAKQYITEIKEDPHPRSIEGIKQRSIQWGRLCGLQAAEAFVLYRHIQKSPESE